MFESTPITGTILQQAAIGSAALSGQRPAPAPGPASGPSPSLWRRVKELLAPLAPCRPDRCCQACR